MIFVFGSNLSGVHGRGAALYAVKHHGAIRGQGIGRAGHSYAIPTKGRIEDSLPVLPLNQIRIFVEDFIEYAEQHPELIFQVTPIGTGLAGYKHEQIAPLFSGAPMNCVMPVEWGDLYTNEAI